MTEIIESNAIGLLKAADELELTSLLDYIQDELIEKHVDWINNHLIELLHISALLQSCNRLSEYCQNEISTSPHLYFESADFVPDLDFIHVESLMLEQQLEHIVFHKFKVIAWGKAQLPDLGSNCQSWTKEDFVNLKNVVEELVPLLRFVSISSADFCYKVMPYKRILPKDLFKEILCFHLNPGYKDESGKLLNPRKKSLK